MLVMIGLEDIESRLTESVLGKSVKALNGPSITLRKTFKTSRLYFTSRFKWPIPDDTHVKRRKRQKVKLLDLSPGCLIGRASAYP
jgi:hypothetical protein